MAEAVLWHIPYQRNPFFTGRTEVLSQLHQAFQTGEHIALSHPLGISGLGGIGKTQIATEYIYRHRGLYRRSGDMTSLERTKGRFHAEQQNW